MGVTLVTDPEISRGGDMTFISLPDVGLHGNSHTMMQQMNTPRPCGRARDRA